MRGKSSISRPGHPKALAVFDRFQPKNSQTRPYTPLRHPKGPLPWFLRPTSDPFRSKNGKSDGTYQKVPRDLPKSPAYSYLRLFVRLGGSAKRVPHHEPIECFGCRTLGLDLHLAPQGLSETYSHKQVCNVRARRLEVMILMGSQVRASRSSWRTR